MLCLLLLAAALPQGDVLDYDAWDATSVPALSLAAGDHFGQSLAVLGDLDGNGVEEVAVGAPYAAGGGTERGAVKILFRGLDGSVESVRTITSGTSGFSGALSDGDLFGWSVAALGDLNADGTADLAVGARRDDDGGTDRGAVWVLFLTSDGSVGSHAKISASAGAFGGALADGDQFGFALAAPGDLDGDGVTELAVSVQMTQNASTVWPGQGAASISAGLPPSFESSGAAWNADRSELILVSDTGAIARTDEDGSVLTLWNVGGDLEGVAIADPASTLVYLGTEDPDSIAEFDLATGALTGAIWFLTPWMSGPAARGLEGLAYGDGLFYAGHQEEGAVYVFDLGPGGAVQLLDILPSPLGMDDLSALHFEPSTGTLYALHGAHDTLIEMTPEGTLLRSYDVPGADQEGFTLITDCPSATSKVIVARDGGSVDRYTNYPVNCYGPESLPGIGAVWMLFLDASGAVQDQERIGLFAGGFGGQLGSGDRFGAALAALGDLDGDAIPDLAVGAPQDDDGGLDRGAVWTLFLGADGRVKAQAKISATQGGGTALADHDQLGWSLAALGDLDGDGTLDLAAGAPGSDTGGPARGALRMLYLTPAGTLAATSTIDAATPGFGATLIDGDQLGTGLGGPIDLDQDGVADLLAGAAGAGAPSTGRAFALELDGVPTAAVLPYGCDAGVDGSLSALAGLPQGGTTLILGVDNPYGSQAAGSLPLLVLAISPAPGFPCGVSLPGFGMSAPGSAGELLISLAAPNPIQILVGPAWLGAGQPAPIAIGVPTDAGLVGVSVFGQAVMWDPSTTLGVEFGLTDALELRIGS